jgi:hypothetical protein
VAELVAFSLRGSVVVCIGIICLYYYVSNYTKVVMLLQTFQWAISRRFIGLINVQQFAVLRVNQ